MEWLDFDHWSKPKDRPILARLPDGTELMVSFNALIQDWIDEHGKGVIILGIPNRFGGVL